MIQEIVESLNGSTLTVEVVCKIRDFAIHPIKVLTTEELIDKIKNKYESITLISSPSRPVGNTNRKRISNTGTWTFEVEERKVEKPKPKRTRATKKTTDQPKQNKKTTTSSIRGRISKLATKED
tara:strand:+ start:364 stop:735 length:372 start_codon:yes stop_codon:yes gene_type:complete